MAKTCARCGAKIGLLTKRIPTPQGDVCEKCLTPEEVKKLEALTRPQGWTCSTCGAQNGAFDFVCKSCGHGVKPR